MSTELNEAIWSQNKHHVTSQVDSHHLKTLNTGMAFQLVEV